MSVPILTFVLVCVGFAATCYLCFRVAHAAGRRAGLRDGREAEAAAWRKKEITVALGADVDLKLTDWLFVEDKNNIVAVHPNGVARYHLTIRDGLAHNHNWVRLDRTTITTYVELSFGEHIFGNYKAWFLQQQHKRTKE